MESFAVTSLPGKRLRIYGIGETEDDAKSDARENYPLDSMEYVTRRIPVYVAVARIIYRKDSEFIVSDTGAVEFSEPGAGLLVFPSEMAEQRFRYVRPDRDFFSREEIQLAVRGYFEYLSFEECGRTRNFLFNESCNLPRNDTFETMYGFAVAGPVLIVSKLP